MLSSTRSLLVWIAYMPEVFRASSANKFSLRTIRHGQSKIWQRTPKGQAPVVQQCHHSGYVERAAASTMSRAQAHVLPTIGKRTSGCEFLEAGQGPRAIEGINTLILDCDGILWRGSEVVPGVPQALKELRRLGKRLCFLTNNSTKSRRQCAPADARLVP
jgi:phosphoglycolate phosphatase